MTLSTYPPHNPADVNIRLEQLREILSRLFAPLDGPLLEDITLDAAWVDLRRGDYLLPEDSASSDVFVVVSGCLEVLMASTPGGPVQATERVCRGEYVGELAILTGEPWSARIRAVRDSVLARFGAAVFADRCRRDPDVSQRIARTAVRRLQRQSHHPDRSSADAAGRNLVVVPLDQWAGDFARRLASAIPGAAHLTGRYVDQLFPRLSEPCPDDPHRIRLAAWLDEQELAHRSVVYEVDTFRSAWTKRCMQRADHVIFVGSDRSDPAPGEVEHLARGWESPQRPPLKSLVLLHAEGHEQPTGTSAWLERRPLDHVYHLRANHDGDFTRLARILSGQAVGLALGGGGARGLAHVGVIRALEEAGIPIDVVGGASVGAVVAAQYAMGLRWEGMLEAYRAFARMKPHRDFTLPLTGLIRGHKFDRSMKRMFQDTRLEDLWVSCFGISTDLTSGHMVVHERGLVRNMLRASCALPGIAVPAVENGHLFVDGGVLNGLPGDVVRRRCGTVIAVDVSPPHHHNLTVDSAEERMPSPWRVLLSRLSPRQRRLAVPNIVEIIERSIGLGSFDRKAWVAADADLYLCPPVGQFDTLDVRSFDDIARAGYLYARREIKAWQDAGARV